MSTKRVRSLRTRRVGQVNIACLPVALFMCLGVARLAFSSDAATARQLIVCADPNNLPFSNRAGEGFENKLVELVAQQMALA